MWGVNAYLCLPSRIGIVARTVASRGLTGRGNGWWRSQQRPMHVRQEAKCPGACLRVLNWTPPQQRGQQLDKAQGHWHGAVWSKEEHE